MTTRLEAIADAFSDTAERYDAFAVDHPNLTRMRGKVYEHVTRIVPAGSRILELNAGTGTDAVELARRGYQVHATDVAPGMLARLANKAADPSLDGRVTWEEASYTDLDAIGGGPYDAVFSNLGGLNCTADLRPVIRQLPSVLRPGGTVTWVLMPPICLWEVALAISGQFGLAFRRLRRGGTTAHLEGRSFEVYYFRPARVAAAFGTGYELLAVEGLSVITPTAESKGLAIRHRRVYGALAWLDDRLAGRPPFHELGDFYILSMRSATAPGSAG